MNPSVLKTSAPGATSRAVARGVKSALPIVLGFVPVGFAFGVLAQKAGIRNIDILMMSIIVFAGSAQLIAVGMIAAKASPLAIVFTTFVVNLRHLLMSAALSPFLRKWSKLEVALMTFELTDETFAMHAKRFATGDTGKTETFALNATAQCAWVGGTLLGLASSSLITDVKPFGLDYALAAMFIALLAGQVTSLVRVLAGLAAGGLAVLLLLAGLDQWNVIIATVAAATLGVGVEEWKKKRSS